MNGAVIIGAGLAGAEAAWQIAGRGERVILYEMRPAITTPAHQTGHFAELVCSNSFRALSLENAVGLLKEEMRLLDSLIIKCALEAQVPSGGALAVDRDIFSRRVTERLLKNPLVEIRFEELTAIPEERPVVIATGPLTSPGFAGFLESFAGLGRLYFYDAAAPIITAESIDMKKAFFASRYGKGGEDYLNCPLNKEEYGLFWRELSQGETVVPREFEKEKFFEGCMPVEVLAKRGEDTLRYGPLKPVGLTAPDQTRPYAVVQLRKEDKEGTLYNMVGFQTRLKWPEQSRIFRLIPGLESAEFVRLGVMHRNTYINAPLLLQASLQMKETAGVFWAGQITGVEGYVESAAMGLIAGINAYYYLTGAPLMVFPPETALGALTNYLVTADEKNFQPMNINFGLFPPLAVRAPRRNRKELLYKRSLEKLSGFQTYINSRKL